MLSFYVSLLLKYKKLKKKNINKYQNIRFCKNQQETWFPKQKWFKKNYGASQILNQNHSHSTPQIPQPPLDPLLPLQATKSKPKSPKRTKPQNRREKVRKETKWHVEREREREREREAKTKRSWGSAVVRGGVGGDHL